MTLGRSAEFLLLYGSETGQSKAIAEEIAEKALSHGLEPNLHCFSQTEKKFWLERTKCAVIIVSTTGDGEVPETAQKFFRRLKKRTLSNNHLSQLHFALLGLGDSNYTLFANGGKNINRRLLELGAKHFYEPAWADDGTGLEVVADPWIDGIFPALRDHLNSITLCIDAEPRELTEPEVADMREIRRERSSSIEENKADVNRLAEQLNNVLSNGKVAVENCEVAGNTSNSNIAGTSASPSDVKCEDVSAVAEAVKIASLTVSCAPLCDAALSVPALPPSCLSLEYVPGDELDLTSLPIQNGLTPPSSQTEVKLTPVNTVKCLTHHDAVKTALLLEVDIASSNWQYSAGDAIGIFAPNNSQEVTDLLKRLEVSDNADVVYSLEVIADTKKKNASIPSHIPCRATLRHTLATCCDIRTTPKKVFLRALAAHCSDEADSRRLLELCSKQGAKDFTSFLRESSVTLLDLLTAFPSCQPPITLILEHVPRLLPRPYSAASSPCQHPGKLRCVFNVVDIPAGDGRRTQRKGVCTGWLQELTKDVIKDGSSEEVTPTIQIPIYLRTNSNFRPPGDLETPVLMIGPGTGVAPFIGFLEHRQTLLTNSTACDAAPCWLFYGCRNKDKDYLFRPELEGFSADGVLSRLVVCFSRDEQAEGKPKYVQDSLRANGAEVADLLRNDRTVIYVCGDARGMAPGVNKAIVDVLHTHNGMSEKEAQSHVMQMRLHRRYVEDVWT